VSQSQGVGEFWWSRIANNTRSRSRIYLSDPDSGSTIRSFFTSHP